MILNIPPNQSIHPFITDEEIIYLILQTSTIFYQISQKNSHFYTNLQRKKKTLKRYFVDLLRTKEDFTNH